MKILIALTPSFDPYAGGVQMSTYKMAKYFSAAGNSAAVFSFMTKGHIKQDFAELYHPESEGGQDKNQNLKILSSVIRKFNPDVVINQMPYEHSITTALTAEKRVLKFLLLGCLRNTLFSVKLNLGDYVRANISSKIPFIPNNRITRSLALFRHKLRHKQDLKVILDHYDYFVMFGPPNKKELEYFVGDYKTHKTAFIPNSIPAVLPNVPPKEKKILWLSRLSYSQKRADLILPFWKKVMNELPDWTFEVVGYGDAYDDLNAQIEKEQIPRITLHGKQKPDEYYRSAPIYIMTSAFEGFPNTLIEAQSYGAVPIVYNNYPVVNWVVENNKNGILIPPFNVDKMADETVHLAKEETRNESMMKAALENAKRFTIDKVGKQWLDFFEEKLPEARKS